MKRLASLLLLSATGLLAGSSKTALIGSQHDLSVTGSGPVKSAGTEACIFCHAPHNVQPNVTPLWNHKLSSQTYTTYTSSTYTSSAQTPASGSSKLCLSCHDGTIAVGLTVTQGALATSGSMIAADVLGANLSTSHPVSMTPVDDGSLALSLFASPASTKDPAVKLVAGKIECTTCHDPHAPRNDPVVPMFLARSNAAGALCLACHDPSRNQPNFLNGWTTGAHATAANTVPANATFGSYGTVSANACWSCHSAHNNGAAPRSLKASEEADCAPCHSGLNASPALRNITAEYTKTYSHPTMTVSGAHDAAEAIPVNNTRHAECADCHNSHAAAAQVGTALPPSSQAAILGARGYDSAGVQNPATKEYQLCFQCHADSTNKPATSTYGRTAIRYPSPLPAMTPPVVQPSRPSDQYNLRLKFTGTIGHNVMGNSVVTTSNASLRLTGMLTVGGAVNTNRPLSTTSMIYCSDCHNNDQAWSSGGTGPNGPHGSIFPHLLQFTLFQDTVGGGGGGGGGTAGAALCNKCHNLTTVQAEAPHNRSEHWSAGCTTCHDPHGVIGGNSTANHAMINFDTGVAGPIHVTAPAVAYNGFAFTGTVAAPRGTCYLYCHNQNHNGYTYPGG